MKGIAEKALESYDDDGEIPAPEDDYSADLESEMGALMAALKSGDRKAAARAFKEAAGLCD